jgi:hypothetical protein
MNSADLQILKALLADPDSLPEDEELVVALTNAFETLCVDDTSNLLLYCIKICDVIFSDAKGKHF